MCTSSNQWFTDSGCLTCSFVTKLCRKAIGPLSSSSNIHTDFTNSLDIRNLARSFITHESVTINHYKKILNILIIANIFSLSYCAFYCTSHCASYCLSCNLPPLERHRFVFAQVDLDSFSKLRGIALLPSAWYCFGIGSPPVWPFG